MLYNDQSISTNLYWSDKDFNEEGKFPIEKLIKVLLQAHKLGFKTLYYCNFLEEDVTQEQGCEGGGCSV